MNNQKSSLDELKQAFQSLSTPLSTLIASLEEPSNEAFKVLSDFVNEYEEQCLSKKAKDRQRTAETVKSRRREMFKNNRKPKGW